MSNSGRDLSLVLNGQQLTDWRAKEEVRYSTANKEEPFTEEYIEYAVPSSLVKKGANRFRFTAHASSKAELIIRDLQLWVFHKQH
jgi:hypothetical protein